MPSIIPLSDMRHAVNIYNRTTTQGPDGEPVVAYTFAAYVRGVVVPRSGNFTTDTREFITANTTVICQVHPEIRAGKWVKCTQGSRELLIGQILEVINPNFEDDHLELRVRDGGGPIDV